MVVFKVYLYRNNHKCVGVFLTIKDTKFAQGAQKI